MTETAIANQMKMSKGVKRLQQTRQCATKMFTIIFIQTVAPHLAIVEIKQG